MKYSIRSLLFWNGIIGAVLALMLLLSQDYRRRQQLQVEWINAGAVYASVTKQGTSLVFASPITVDQLDRVSSLSPSVGDLRLECQGFCVDRDTLSALAKLQNVKSLMFQSCTLDNSGDLRALSPISESLQLSFWSTPLADGDLVHVSKLSKLRSLLLVKTKVSPSGAQQLKEWRPQLHLILR